MDTGVLVGGEHEARLTQQTGCESDMCIAVHINFTNANVYLILKGLIP